MSDEPQDTSPTWRKFLLTPQGIAALGTLLAAIAALVTAFRA